MEKNYKFSQSHEWVRVEGQVAYVGISTYAAKKLGEIVFVDMPALDDEFAQFAEFGAIESVKAASELYLPISGKVIEVNEALNDQPELINQDATKAWIVKIEVKNIQELSSLLSYDDYLKICK